MLVFADVEFKRVAASALVAALGGPSSWSQSSQRNCWLMACSGAVAPDQCAINSSMSRFGMAKINGIWTATESGNPFGRGNRD